MIKASVLWVQFEHNLPDRIVTIWVFWAEQLCEIFYDCPPDEFWNDWVWAKTLRSQKWCGKKCVMHGNHFMDMEFSTGLNDAMYLNLKSKESWPILLKMDDVNL